jgi:hypothetical protein
VTDDNKIENSLIPIGSTGIVRVDNTINITNKLLGILTTKEFEVKYGAIQINESKYTSLNFAETKFRNGDSIKEARTEDEWKYCVQNQIPACCSYNNNPQNDLHFGKLYNFYCISDSRGLAPNGWEIIDRFPSKRVSDLQSKYFDVFELMSESDWELEYFNTNQELVNHSKNNNSSLFNAKPSGMRDEYGNFLGLNSHFSCWTGHSEDGESNFDKPKTPSKINILRINRYSISQTINLGMGWLGSKLHSVANFGEGHSIRFKKHNGSSI